MGRLEAVASRARKRIVYAAILLMAASGVSAATATRGGQTSPRLPGWARQGFIVYRCDGGLCLARPGRGRVRPLADLAPAPQWDPAVSPDGKLVAFRGYWGVPDGAYALYVVGTDGCTPRRLTRGIAGNPSWSPDGKWIVFDTSGEGQLWKIHPDGTQLTRLGGGARRHEASPAWSPDGNKIAFVRTVRRHDQIWVMNANGTQPVRLRAAARLNYEEPSWARNGKRIAFVAMKSLVGRSWIEVMNANGTHLRTLTSRHRYAWNPVWLPHDAGIAWLAGAGSGGSIFVARPNGSGARRMLRAQAEQFAWSSAPLERRACK